MLSVHERKKPFECKICQTLFYKSSSLDTHIDTHHKGKLQFKCEICEKRFSDKRGFIYHCVNVHEVKNPFECEPATLDNSLESFKPEQELNN